MLYSKPYKAIIWWVDQWASDTFRELNNLCMNIWHVLTLTGSKQGQKYFHSEAVSYPALGLLFCSYTIDGGLCD